MSGFSKRLTTTKLTLRKIAIWLSKNWQKLDFFFFKLLKLSFFLMTVKWVRSCHVIMIGWTNIYWGNYVMLYTIWNNHDDETRLRFWPIFLNCPRFTLTTSYNWQTNLDLIIISKHCCCVYYILLTSLTPKAVSFIYRLKFQKLLLWGTVNKSQMLLL